MNFLAHLKQQYDEVGHFIDILDQEQAVLTASPIDGERLTRITEDKTACATQLEKLDQARQAILAKQGYTTDRAGAEKMAKAKGCMPAWRAFVKRAGQAQVKNQMIGMLVGQRLDINQESLAALNSISGAGLYGPDGQTNSGKYLHRSV